MDAEIIRSFTIPTFMLSFASGIMPKYIRRNKQCLIPHNQQALHDTVTTSAPGRKRQQSCHMFSEQAKQLTGDAQGKTNRTWVEGTWKIRWHTTHCILAEFIHSPSSTDICHDLTRHSIVRLYRVRTFYGRFKYNMNLMGLSPSASCECGAASQTAHLLASECPLHSYCGDLVTLNTTERNGFAICMCHIEKSSIKRKKKMKVKTKKKKNKKKKEKIQTN